MSKGKNVSCREPLIVVTYKDCDWTYERGTGPGGQKRNKTETKVRCVHRASGAVGVSDATRSQHKNKIDAFQKMARSDAFQRWARIEVSRVTGEDIAIKDRVERMLRSEVLVEVKDEKGRWVPAGPMDSKDDLSKY